MDNVANVNVRYCAAALAGAALSTLLHRRRSSRSESSTVDPLDKPFDCHICRIRWRQPPPDPGVHLASKEHRRNLALLKGSAPDGGAMSRANENLHCSYCDVWVRDSAAYALHAAGRKHARAVATSGGTAQHDFFRSQHVSTPTPDVSTDVPGSNHVGPLPSEADSPSETITAAATAATAATTASCTGCGVITCDLEKPGNAGSICRLLSNFSAVGSSLTHVHSLAPETQSRLLRSSAMQLAARHSDAKLTRRALPLADFLSSIAHWPRPIVAVETAAGAVDIHTFTFPRRCDVLVGGETRGIHPSILAALRPGVDAIVFIPMPGFAHSMNVATATCVALYEHRKQHPH